MPLIALNPNYFSPLFNASLLYDRMGADFDPKEGERTVLPISLEDLEKVSVTYEEELYSVEENVHGLLLALFGEGYLELPCVQAVLSVTYIGDTVKYIRTPVLTKRDDVVGLMIGDDKLEDQTLHQFFPLVVVENRLTFEGTKTLQLGLDSLEIKRNDGTAYRLPLVTIPHPERKSKVIYQLGVQVTPDCDYANFQLSWNNLNSLNEDDRQEAWDDIKAYISSGVSANAKLDTLFGAMMKRKEFPKKGVLIPITSLIKAGKISKKDGTGKFFQASFGINTSGFPSVHVSAYLAGDSDDVPLNTVGSISCGDRDNLGKLARTNLVKDNPPTGINPWYLFISAPNAKGNKIPEHAVFTSDLPVRYQRLLEEQKTSEYWGV